MMKAISAFFIFGVLSSSLYPGIFSINTSNYLNLGLTYQNVSSLNTDNGFYYTGGSAKQSLIISGLRIANGHKWTKIKLTLRSTTGSVNLTIRDNAGISFFTRTGITSTSEFDFSNYPAASSGKPIIVLLEITKNINIDQIDISYSGNAVYAYPSPFIVSAGKLNIVYDLPNPSYVTLRIFDSRGRLVKTLATGRFTAAKSSPRESVDTWDGRNDSGQIVSSGLYYLHLSVVAISSGAEAKLNYGETFRFVLFR